MYMELCVLRAGHIGAVVACLTEDRQVRGSYPTRAKCEFLRAQEMNLQGSAKPWCDLVP